jgi:hypothetical protein
MGFVEIAPKPQGATAYISDLKGVVAAQFKTPDRRKVEAGKPFRVRIELDGYEPYEVENQIEAGQTLLIAPRLDKAKAALKVTTTPDGAQVSLRGKLLGETPLVRNDLDELKGELVISKTGFEPYKQKVELAAGKTVEITQALKAATKYGELKLLVPNGWGDVYYNGKMIGRAPGILRAPVGKVAFRLVNTGSKPSIKWDVTCEVSESEQKTCTTKMPK